MEHLTLPRGALLEEDERVPYLCADIVAGDPYDGGPFLEYPERIGQTGLLSQLRSGVGMPQHRQLREISVYMIETFIQSWLFFGLLHEYLKDAFAAADFVTSTSEEKEDDGGLTSAEPGSGLEVSSTDPSVTTAADGPAYITTEALRLLIDDWRQTRQTVQDYERLNRCLIISIELLHALPETFNNNIRLCISSVVVLLIDTLHSVHPDTVRLRVPAVEPFGRDRTAMSRMLRLGWCPRELANLDDEQLRMPLFHYLSHLDKRVPHRTHDRCTITHCHAYASSVNTPFAHDVDFCRGPDGCEKAEVDGEELVACLETGIPPVLAISLLHDPTPKFHLAFAPAVEEIRYVAISHVWADGLGNPHEQSLPLCQIRRLYHSVQALFDLSNDDIVYMWIDVMCCPSSAYPEAKAHVLSIMELIYTYADTIIVVDASLRRQNRRDMDALEFCARVATSGWMTRLWTFQEAALAEKLFVLLKDGGWSLDGARLDLLRIMSSNVYDTYIASGLYQTLLSLRAFPSSAMNASKDHPRYQALCNGISTRAVTVASDEPLCLATLMRLPASATRHIAKAPAEDRMPDFWRLAALDGPGIPQSIIFLARPKLEVPGLRWAPRTLLCETRLKSEDWVLEQGSGPYYGQLDDTALTVQFAGSFLEAGSMPQMYDRLAAAAEWAKGNKHCRSASGQWYNIGLGEDRDPESHERLNNLLFEPVASEQRQLAVIWPPLFEEAKDGRGRMVRAILVEVMHQDPEHGHRVRFLQYIGISLVPADESLAFEAGYQAGCQMRADIARHRPGMPVPVPDWVHPGSASDHFTDLEEYDRRASEALWGLKQRLGIEGSWEEAGKFDSAAQLSGLLTRTFWGLIGVMGEPLPSTTTWHVD